MKIIIVGAGRIGGSIAESLVSEANDITVIDMNPSHIEQLQSHFDLRGLIGDATSPDVLIQAGAEDTDMLIAVTASDETNLVVTLLAAKLFNIPTRIARVRNSELRNHPQILGKEGFGATSIIWPEQTITNYIVKLIKYPGANQMFEFGDGSATLISVRTKAGSPLVGRPISDLRTHLPKIAARIVTVFRRNRRLELNTDTVIESGDEVIVLCDARQAKFVLREFRYGEEPARNIILAGNPFMSRRLVDQLIENDGYDVNIKIIENDSEKAKRLAKKIKDNGIVIAGDYTNEDTLNAAGIESCDLFITLSEDDEDNIMSSLLAKRLGAERTIALVNRKSYRDIFQGSQIDLTISPTQAALGELIKHVRRGDVSAVYTLHHGMAEAMEIVAHGTKQSSKVVGRRIGSINLPAGCTIAAVVRGREEEAQVLMGDAELVVEAEDHVIIFVPNKRLIPKVERLFTVDVGFF